MAVAYGMAIYLELKANLPEPMLEMLASLRDADGRHGEIQAKYPNTFKHRFFELSGWYRILNSWTGYFNDGWNEREFSFDISSDCHVLRSAASVKKTDTAEELISEFLSWVGPWVINTEKTVAVGGCDCSEECFTEHRVDKEGRGIMLSRHVKDFDITRVSPFEFIEQLENKRKGK